MQAAWEIEAARKAVWHSRPEEVRRVRGRKGARNQNFTIMAYSAADTRGVVDFLHSLRVTAKAGDADLQALAAITANYLEFQASRFERYYDMVELSALTRKTITGLKQAGTVGDFVEVLEAYTLYIGKLHFWLDLELPWATLAEEYERVKAAGDGQAR